MEATKDYLSGHGIRPSVQRIAIMDYLLTHKTHPTVDEIFTALAPTLPTLSKTTLYNTLKLFYEKKVALMLTLDDKNARFDGDTRAHAHFQCEGCSRVFDIFDDELPELKLVARQQIGQLSVNSCELSYRGLCQQCRVKN